MGLIIFTLSFLCVVFWLTMLGGIAQFFFRHPAALLGIILLVAMWWAGNKAPGPAQQTTPATWTCDAAGKMNCQPTLSPPDYR